VLYLALEDNERRMQTRLRKLGASRIELNVSFQAPRINQDLVAELSKAIAKNDYDVIIIDTLAAISAVTRRNKGVWAGDYDTVSVLQQLASKHNVAIILVTHTKKNADRGDAQDAIVTTTGVLAGADAYWIFQKPPSRDMQLTVRVEISRRMNTQCGLTERRRHG
jgi:RecA-family ATPase